MAKMEIPLFFIGGTSGVVSEVVGVVVPFSWLFDVLLRVTPRVENREVEFW